MSRDRNKPCSCGSGKKSKRCCGSAGGLAVQLLDPGPVPQRVKDDADRMMAAEGYDSAASAALLPIDRAKRARSRHGSGFSVAGAALVALTQGFGIVGTIGNRRKS